MNWKKCRRNWSWPNLRYYPGFCPWELKKITKTLKIGDVSFEIRIAHLLNVSQKFYLLFQIAGYYDLKGKLIRMIRLYVSHYTNDP
jgi:hypothetical protein